MIQEPLPRRIFLVGFMGAGKTSVGRVLGERLGWSFRDLDEVIEAQQGTTIAQIFAEAGEAAFRRIEAAALRELLQERDEDVEGIIVALGGGVFAQPENRKALSQAGGTIVFLEAPIDELRRRCAVEVGKRPLAADEEKFAELYSSRRPSYELATWRVHNVNKTVEQAAAEIENLIAAAERR